MQGPEEADVELEISL